MLDYKKFKIKTITELLGGVPASEEIYRNYILSKSPDEGDPYSDEIETVPHKHDIDPDEQFKEHITGFYRHPRGDGLIMYDYQFLGFLKEAGNNLKDALGIKNLRAKINKHIVVYPRRVLIADVPDTILQRPLRAQTQQGPRIALAASECLNPPIEFEIIIGLIDNKEKVDWEVINKILKYGEIKGGLLQWRNAGYGRFTTKDLGEVDPNTIDLPTF